MIVNQHSNRNPITRVHRLIACACLGFALQAQSQSALDPADASLLVPALDAAPPVSGIWADGAVGSGFRRELHEAGFTVGGGFVTHDLGGFTPHDVALARAYYGWMLGGVRGGDSWYRGNWELLQEVFGGMQFHPKNRYLIGETTCIRYNLATGTPWVPFLDAGAGVAATDIGPPDLGSVFEFNLQIGPGVRYFWRKNSALTFQYRFIHICNAGIRDPNQGLNEHVFYVGMSWLF